MKRSTTRILAATAIAGLGLVGVAAASLADGDDYRRWGKRGGDHYGMGGYGMGGYGGGHGMSGYGNDRDMIAMKVILGGNEYFFVFLSLI